MPNIAIITARGGSKRIPKKNIKEFCGKPIIAYSIEAALNSELFDEVMVSTDSDEIAQIAMQYGAKVPFYRSEETSDDFATTADVLEEVLQCYEETGMEYEMMCCIYPTAPFVTSSVIRQAYDCMKLKNADSVVPIVAYSFPPQRAFVVKNGMVKYNNPENERVRSQDLERLYHDCGQFYMCKVNPFRLHKTLIMPNTAPIIISEENVQDIDSLTDWKLAELKYQLLLESKGV